MKSGSASVQNFEHLVKQIIDGANRDDQIYQFQRMVYEEWYFKKTESQCNDTGAQDSSQQDISATVAHRRHRKPKYKRNPVDTGSINNNANEVRHAEQSYMYGSRDTEQCNDGKGDLNEMHNNHVAPATDPSADIVEIWSKSVTRPNKLSSPKQKSNNVSEKNHASDRIDGSMNEKQNKDLSFNDWKKRKTVLYKETFKRIVANQQQKLLKEQENLELKRATQQKRQQAKSQLSQKLISKHNEMTKRINTVIKWNVHEDKKKKDINERVSGSLYASKRAFDKIRKKILTPAMQNRKDTVEESKAKLINNNAEKFAFYSWLNQLNSVLRSKYIRERRHLVQSYYCQPFYYCGNAKMYAT